MFGGRRKCGRRDDLRLDNHAYVVSHVGLSNDEHWEDFRELDFDDQRMIREWIGEEADDDDNSTASGQPRRFDQGMLVDDELIGEFIAKSFLDPEDDRVLDEFLGREIGGGGERILPKMLNLNGLLDRCKTQLSVVVARVVLVGATRPIC